MALGITKKSIERRRDLLNLYLDHLLDLRNMLCRCPELLQFLGANDAFPPEVKTGIYVRNLTDALGRSEMRRTELNSENLKKNSSRSLSSPSPTKPRTLEAKEAHSSSLKRENQLEGPLTTSRKNRQASSADDSGMSASGRGGKRGTNRSRRVNSLEIANRATIKAKIDRVKLGQVRKIGFELVRYLFNLDNANFFRSRMFSALKTMSLAVTSAQDFNKMMYEMHLTHINGKALSYWITYMQDTMWPGGVYGTSAPALTSAEKKELEQKSKALLPQAFPDQIRKVLGQELTEDGLNVFHEMLQNRIVLKSMVYMIMDMVWLEIFPEMSDILSGAEALETEE
mmetsp:Transcript_38805/g.57003  ORF Transcript_38805/g.57003 Transcript_38805/m.57003 type:complete len:341 (+) Transcript_38805:386-1408(+)